VANKDQDSLAEQITQNNKLQHRLNTIEKEYKEQLTQVEEINNEYKAIIQKLKDQVTNYQYTLKNVREHYVNAEKERIAATIDRFNQERTSYENDIIKKEQTIMSLKQDIKREKMLNETTQVKPKTTVVVYNEVLDELSLNNSALQDNEYLMQKDRWVELERETELLKDDIKVAFIPTDPQGIHPVPNKIHIPDT